MYWNTNNWGGWGQGGGLLHTPHCLLQKGATLAWQHDAEESPASYFNLIIPAFWKFWKTYENDGMVLGERSESPPLLGLFMFSQTCAVHP